MDLSSHGLKLVSPIPSPPPFSSSPPQSARTTFLITAAVVVLASALLLISLYVIKCFTNYQRISRLRRFSFSRSRADDAFVFSSPDVLNGGLDRSLMQSIPTYEFKKAEGNSWECAVCLNEFQEGEKLRVIPHCSHGFHIDCIDVWLRNNANCPLCRNCISASTIFPSSPRDPNPGGVSGYFTAESNEDCVVIELDGHTGAVSSQERSNSVNHLSSNISISPSPTPKFSRKNPKKSRQVTTSVGDECIDIRQKDEQFAIQPIRRSFSMDSAADRQLYLAVQKTVLQQKQRHEIISPGEGSSCRINKKSFFSFGYGRGSKNSVQTGSFGTLNWRHNSCSSIHLTFQWLSFICTLIWRFCVFWFSHHKTQIILFLPKMEKNMNTRTAHWQCALNMNLISVSQYMDKILQSSIPISISLFEFIQIKHWIPIQKVK